MSKTNVFSTDQRWVNMETVEDAFFRHLCEATPEDVQQRIDCLFDVTSYDLAALKHLDGTVDIVDLLYKKQCASWEDRIKEVSEVVDNYQQTHSSSEQIKIYNANSCPGKFEKWKEKYNGNPTKDQIKDFLLNDGFPLVDFSGAPGALPEDWNNPFQPVAEQCELVRVSLCELYAWAQRKCIDMSSFDVGNKVALMESFFYGNEGFRHYLSFLNNSLFFDGFAIVGIEYEAERADRRLPHKSSLSLFGYPYNQTAPYEKNENFVVKKTRDSYYVGWRECGVTSSVRHGRFETRGFLPSSSVLQSTVADVVCTTDDENKVFAYAGIASLALNFYNAGLWQYCRCNRKHPKNIYNDLLTKTSSGDIADEGFLNAIFSTPRYYCSCNKVYELLGVKALHLLYFIGMYLTGFCGKSDDEQDKIVVCAEKVAAMFV